MNSTWSGHVFFSFFSEVSNNTTFFTFLSVSSIHVNVFFVRWFWTVQYFICPNSKSLWKNCLLRGVGILLFYHISDIADWLIIKEYSLNLTISSLTRIIARVADRLNKITPLSFHKVTVTFTNVRRTQLRSVWRILKNEPIKYF